MKKNRIFLLYCLFALFTHTYVCAQEPYCKNLSFELGDFTNWVGSTWQFSTEHPEINTPKLDTIANRRQTIMSDVNAYDANTGYALKIIPAGYKYSARLGDSIIRTPVKDPSPRCWQQTLRYTMKIDSSNALLIMKFALVLEYQPQHTREVEPRFSLTLYDQNGDTIHDCSNYDVYASLNVEGFQTYVRPNNSRYPIKWRDWTTVGADLSKYYGQTITIEFLTADCTETFHFGYAYFLAECHPLRITLKYCADDSIAGLTAPEGFERYSWTNSSGTVVDTSRFLYVHNPTEGAVYSCKLTSATGCMVTLQSTIARYELKANFNSKMTDCFLNTVQLNDSSTHTHGNLMYKWDFGNGNTSTRENPLFTFATSGMHTVSLYLNNPPSTCVDNITKVIESFAPPLVGITGASTYCPGLGTFLKAYGAHNYTWSNDSTTDSIEIRSPGGKYWLIGHSSTGCFSEKKYKTVLEEPDWAFKNGDDTTFCTGDSSNLKVSGAVKYLWDTGSSNDSLTVSKPGTYTVIGTNKRGCKKTRIFDVLEYPLPNADFTILGAPLDKKHNQVTCTALSQINKKYDWEMGDGSTETGSVIQHPYNISIAFLKYTITQIATSLHGCVDSISKAIDVTPFVPNVFSPNGDGKNDVFMDGVELQVFDRNGFVIYKGKSGWDGRYNQQEADPDTYFYMIRYPDKNMQMQIKKGYITLVR